MKSSRTLLWLFAIISAAEVLAVALELKEVQLVAKPLIVILLIGYYLTAAPKRSLIFILALIFCWGGDVFLMFQSTVAGFFIFGLLSFLIGHVLYLFAYRGHQWADTQNELIWTQKFRYSLPIILSGTGLISILFPDLGSLRIPVVVYAVALIVMVMSALFRYGRTSSTSFWMVFSGAALFMVSDSILALNKFHSPIEFSGVLIMVSYISAQYLIVEGIVKHELKAKS